MHDGRLTHPADDWRKYSAGYHIQRATKHLAQLQAGDWREPHLTDAITHLMMALELRRLALNNGCYIPRPRCYGVEPLRRQRWCRACLTAYARERRARMRQLPDPVAHSMPTVMTRLL